MGVTEYIRKKYRKIDARLGGVLPGGVSSKPSYDAYVPSPQERESGTRYSGEPLDIPTPNGGSNGGGSRGGTSRGGTTVAGPTAADLAAEQARQAAAKAAAEKAARDAAALAATRTQAALRNGTTIRSGSKSGGVRVTREGEATRTFTGGAYIAELGMTANEYKRQQRLAAKEQFGAKKGDKIRFTTKQVIEAKEVLIEEPKEVSKVGNNVVFGPANISKKERDTLRMQGEVQLADKTIAQKAFSLFTKTPTKEKVREVIDTKFTEGGVLESRVVSKKGGIKSTEIYFIPKSGSEMQATPEQKKKFRELQSEAQPVYQQKGILGLSQKLESQEKIKGTKFLRTGEAPSIKETGKSVLTGAAVSLLGTGALIKSVATEPKQTFRAVEKGLVETSERVASGELFKSAKTIVKEQPAYVLGNIGIEIAQDVLLGKAAIGLGSKVIKAAPKTRVLSIPQKLGDDIPISLFGVETKKGRGFILGSKSPSGAKLGSPDIVGLLEKIPDTTEIKIASVLETKALERGIKLSAKTTTRAKEILPPFKTLLGETFDRPSKFIDQNLLFSATERLPRKGVSTVLDIAKKEKGILFGSKSRAAQLAPEFDIGGKKFKLQKVPRDIEVRFDTVSAEKLQDITESTISRLKKLDTIEEEGKIFKLGTAREIKDTPFAIEAKVGDTFEKVVEFKGGPGIPDVEDVPEFVAGFKKTSKPIKLAGIETTGLSEELRGVSQGVLRVRRQKDTGLIDIFPSPKRTKDIGSISVSARTLEMSKPSVKVRGAIEKIESLFPEELVREQVTEVLKTPKKTILADFSSSSVAIKSPQSKVFLPIASSSSIAFAPSPSTSPSVSPSVSPSISPLASISPSISASPSVSPSISPSISPSVSPSISPSISPSVSISPSISPSPSVSPSISPSTSPSKARSPSPFIPSPISLSPSVSAKRKRVSTSPSIIKQAGYIAQVKQKGEWKNVSNKAYLKPQAEKLAKHAADKTIAASARVKPTSKTPALDALRLTVNNNKFRDFKISGGKQVPLKDQWIEKRKHRLDTKKETQTLQQYKRSSEFKSITGGAARASSSFVSSRPSDNILGGFVSSKKSKSKKKKTNKWLSF